MTREDYTQEILELSDSHPYLMLHLPTGFGKSKVAIDIIKRHIESNKKESNVLIVVPKLVLMDNWKAEFQKWGFPQNVHIIMSTYVSYPKHADTHWDMIILDEAHHFTETCEDATIDMQYDRVLAMSATIPREPSKVSARTAIDDEILPDPKILLIPMMLDNTFVDQVFVVRKSKPGIPIDLTYQQKGQRFNYPYRRVHIHCTQQQYYNLISAEIDRKREDYFKTQEVFKKNQWLMLCKNRLDWMTTLKEDFVLELLKLVDQYRTLTFCTFIEQTEKLGEYPINSKDKKQLNDFNEGKVNHIVAANILNEGVNLSNCQIGIYANIGASKVVELQRLGRILRHKNPLIIIPFFAGTREEELVNKMVENYNPELITTLFKSQINEEAITNIING